MRALDHAILAEHGCEVAESSKAEGSNRYCDVLPFDSNRLVEVGRVGEGGLHVCVMHLVDGCWVANVLASAETSMLQLCHAPSLPGHSVSCTHQHRLRHQWPLCCSPSRG